MAQLASCYFCGVAAEAPLEEYPVVPRDLRPSIEDQSTVVLCPKCRRKLSTIVERVVAATRDPAQTELGNSPETADEKRDRADDDGPSPIGTLERFDDERPNLVDFERSHERNADMIAREEKQDPDEEVSETGQNEAGDGRVGAESTDRSDEGTYNRPDEGISGEEDAEDDDGADAGGRETTEGEDAGGTDGSTDRDFSRSAYNKVVKLLQNREFPVEEEEIATVAGSAYGIGRRETDEVIETLIDRGILERDGSQIHRADE